MFAARLFSRGRVIVSCSRGWTVLKIRCDYRCEVVVVARVQYQTDHVPNPARWDNGAKIVKDKHFGFEYRAQNFRGVSLHRGIVRILYLLQQLPVVAKKTSDI